MTKKHWAVIGGFAGLFAALTWLGWMFLVKPVSQDIDAKKSELEAAKAKLAEAQAKAAQHDKFQALAENVRRDLALVSSRVHGDLPAPELYRMLSAQGNRLALLDYVFENKPREDAKDAALPGMDRIPVRVEFKSGYHHAGLFLSAIGGQERLLVPDRFTLKSLNLAGKPPLEVKMELSLYLEKLK